MRAGAWRVYPVVGTSVVIGYFLLPDDWWQTSANPAIGLAGAAGLLVGIRLHRPRRQGLWWMLAGGLVCIAAGDFVYALYERVLRALPGQGRRPGPNCRRRPAPSGVALTRIARP